MNNKITKHIHHIIPRHAGGTDDESNLVSLTVEEHANAHKELFEKHGRWQDKAAWQGLSGQIGKDEIIQIMKSEAGKIGGKSPASNKQKEVASVLGKIYGKINGKINGLLPNSDKQKEVASILASKRNIKNNPMKDPITKAKSLLSRSKRPETIAKWTKELAKLKALESQQKLCCKYTTQL